MQKLLVEELLLKGFTSHPDRKIVFRKPETFVIGPNASGKTSVKDGFEWLLTGACEGTDAGGRGYEGLIGDDVEAMRVSALIAGERVSRTADAKGVEFAVEGWQGGRKTLETEFYKKITGGKGLTRGQIRALMNSTWFCSLPPAEQKEIILAALGFDFGKAELSEMVNGQVDSVTLAAILEPIPETKRGAKLLDAVYNAGFAERREAKRALKVLEDQADDRPDEELPAGVETGDLKDDQALLATLRVKRDELIRKREAISSGAINKTMVEAEMTRLEARHADLEGQAADMTKMIASADTPGMDDLQGRADVQREGIAKVAKEIAVCEAEIDRLTGVVDQFEANPGHCVADSSIKCAVTGKGTKVYLALHDALATARESLGSLRATHGLAAKSLVAMGEDLAKYEARQRHKAGLEAKLNATKENLDDVEDQIEAKGNELITIVKALQPIPDALVAEIADLDDRIAKGEAVVEAIIRREEVEKHIRGRKEQLAAAQARVAVLEQMVEVFGPQGIVVSMIAERKGQLFGPMAEAVRALTGGEYALEFDDDLAPRVSHHGRIRQRLSDSERLRIGIGVQVGLAKALSFPLIMIDKADMLDPENRGLFAEGLAGLVADGLQVVVLATAAADVVGGDELTDYVVLRKQTAQVGV